jgi:hypothetical protein
VGHVTDEQDRDTPIASIETVHQPTDDASTKSPPKRTGSAESVASKVKAGVTSAVNAVQGGFRSLRSRSRAAEKESAVALDQRVSQSSVPEPAAETAPTARRSTRARSFTPNYSLRRSRKPSTTQHDKPSVSANGGEFASQATEADTGFDGRQSSITEPLVGPEADNVIQAAKEDQITQASTEKSGLEDHVNADNPSPKINGVDTPNEVRAEQLGEDVEDSNLLLQSEPIQETHPADVAPENAISVEEPSAEEIAIREAQAILDTPSKTVQLLEKPKGRTLHTSSPLTPRKREAPQIFDSSPRPAKRLQTRKTRARESLYISPEEEDHQTKRTEGLPGIYIDRSESEQRKRESTKRYADSFVLVFKSTKLREPNWLEEHKGTGIEPIAAAIAAAIIEKENNAQVEIHDEEILEQDELGEGGERELRSTATPEPESPNVLEPLNPSKLPELPQKTSQSGSTTAKDSRKTSQPVQDQEQVQLPKGNELSTEHQRTAEADGEKRKRDDGDDASAISQPHPKRRKSNTQINAESVATDEHDTQAATAVAGENALPSAEQPLSQTPKQPIKRKYTKKRPSNTTTDPQEPKKKKQRKDAAGTQIPAASIGSSAPYQHPPNGPEAAGSSGPPNPQEILQSPFQPSVHHHGSTASFPRAYPSNFPAFYHGPGSSFQAQPPRMSPYSSPYSNTPAAPSMLSAVPQHVQQQGYKSPYQSPYSNRLMHQIPDANVHARQEYTLGGSSTNHSFDSMNSQQEVVPSPQTYRSPYATNTPSTLVQIPQPDAVLLDNSQPLNIESASTPDVEKSNLFSYYEHQSKITRKKRPQPEPISESVASKDPTPAEVALPAAPQSPSVAPPPTTKEARSRKAKPVDETPLTKAQKAVRLAATKKAKVEADLITAEAVDVPEGVVRLAAVYKGSLGNVLLSADKSTLEFFGVGQHPPQVPMLALPISRMESNPITSVRGSYPMELRATFRKTRWPKVFSFQFSTTKEGFESASNMRAKLITAKITTEVKRAAGPLEKPYKCDKCDAQFLNDIGLKYHVTKSQTTCNPNWDPSLKKPRGRQASSTPRKQKPIAKIVPESSSSSSDSSESESEEEDDEIDVEMDDVELDDDEPEVQNDEGSDSDSGDSDDSIFEWAKTVATNGLDLKKGTAAPLSTPTRTKRGNGYRRLRGEVELLKDIIGALKQAGHQTKRMVVPTARASQPLAPPVDQQQFQKIILSLVEDNGGAFPGDKSLWYAVFAAWFQKPFQSGTLPEFKFCTHALDQLIDKGKLQKVEFNFSVEGRQGRSSWNSYRAILVTPNTGSKSSQVKKIQNLILESYPEYYVPSQYAPPEPWMSKLKTLVATQGNGTLRRPTRTRDEDEEEDFEELEELRPRLRRRYSDLRVDESSESSFDHEADFDDPAEGGDETDMDLGDNEDEEDDRLSRLTRQRSRSMGTSEPIEGGRPRRTIRRQSSQTPLVSSLRRSVRRKAEAPSLAAWAPAPVFIPDPETGAWGQVETQVPAQQPKRVGKGLPQDEKDRRAQRAYTRLHAWDPIPTVIPNPKTGAWNQKVAKVFKPYARKYRIPEPITFLQDPSGAWSQRAFGHGVNPIFSRPSRRADGNLNYTNKLESGFRPVVTPKNGMLFAAAPSKVLLRRLEAGSPTPARDSELQASIEPKDSPRKPRAAKKRVSLAEEPAGPRISKITGRPVQKYVRKEPYQRRESTRRQSTLSIVEPVAENSELVPEPENVRRSGRAVKKTVQSLDEVELLNFFPPPPPPVEPDVPLSQNPGLKTLPRSFWSSDSSYRGTKVRNFAAQYENLQYEDPKTISEDCDMTEGSWVYEGWQIPTPDHFGYDFKIRWSNDTAFTMEDLPYKELDLVVQGVASEPKQVATPQRKRQRRESVLSATATAEHELFDTLRPLTALREDFQHVLEDPQEAPLMFGVEVAEASSRVRSRRGKKSKPVSSAFETRLVTVVVIIRTLTGGLEGSVDWVLISRMFPDYTITFLTSQWRQLQKKCSEKIEKLVAGFQTTFLEAYQKGEVAPIDFDKLMEYDWDKLIDWVISTINPSLGTAVTVALPSTREGLEIQYEVQEGDSDPDNWREVYFASSGKSIYKRISVATSIPNASPLHPPEPQIITDFTVTKSWVRAIALTPEETWAQSSDIAREKLNSLGLDLVKTALTALTTSKTLHHRSKGRASPGRSYEATDAFLAPLRKDIKNETFVQAGNYKKYLDAMFAAGHEKVRVDYMADEGAVLCISSLQASRRVRLVGVDVPMSRFGLCGDGLYEMRVDREKFRWEIDIVPTQSYTYDDFLPLPDLNPSGIGPNGEIPVWISIGGDVIWELWRKILPAVAQIVALRSGVTVEGLKREFRPTLEEWEIRGLMEWGVQRGVFERVSPRVEGWTVGEWWWVFVARAL